MPLPERNSAKHIIGCVEIGGPYVKAPFSEKDASLRKVSHPGRSHFPTKEAVGIPLSETGISLVFRLGSHWEKVGALLLRWDGWFDFSKLA